MNRELIRIDCNCNDCKFMQRDFERYEHWRKIKEGWQRDEFERNKAKSDPLTASKMVFQFDKSGLLQYGNCTKLNKPVSFIPNTCQLETQQCFEDRKP